MSQGTWSKEAAASGAKIREAIEVLQKDPNCSEMAGLFASVDMPIDPTDEEKPKEQKQENAESYNGGLGAMAGEAISGMASPTLLTGILKILLDRAAWKMRFNNEDVSKGRRRFVQAGLGSLDKLFGALPKYKQCLIGRPAMSTMLLSSAIKMLAAYSGSGESNLSRVAETIKNFTNYMRDDSFADVYAKLDQAKLTNSISCLSESTSETYCRVKDAYELNNLAGIMSDNEVKYSAAEQRQINNPTEGYFILTRETPTISAWMQNVMFGVRPRTNSDAAFKNKVLDNINDFLQAQNLAYGAYETAALQYKAIGANNMLQRKNHLYRMLEQLTEIMMGRGTGGSRGDVNFFDRTVQAMRIPFFLIGIEGDLPAAVKPNDNGKVVMGTWDYILNGGEYREQFDNPDKLLSTMGKQLEKLLKDASVNASRYFQQQLIVDLHNLVDQSLASSTISVYESFLNMEAYLTKLIDRAESSEDDIEMGILPNLVRTRRAIGNVLESYRELFGASRALVDRLRTAEPGEKSRIKREIEKEFEGKEFEEKLTAVIGAAYANFNVMLQRDTLLLNRINTFVEYDYSYYARHSDLLSQYQRDLLMVSSKNLLEVLYGAQNANPTEVLQDLHTAQNTNRDNLSALELFFREKMIKNIALLKLIADGKGNSWATQKWDAFKRYWNDSQFDDMKQLSTTRYADSLVADYTINWYKRNVVLPNPFALVYGLGSFLRSPGERYYITESPFNEAPIQRDNAYGSTEQLKSRLCIQTLPYNNYYEFHRLCEGSVLKSALNDGKLDQSYDKLYQAYIETAMRAQKVHIPFTPKNPAILEQKLRFDDNICALRDFRRRNHVEYLTRQMGIKEGSRKVKSSAN